MMRILKKINLNYFLLVAYLATFLIPELYTMDRIAPQYFYLSIINFSSLIIFSLNQNHRVDPIFFQNPFRKTIYYCVLVIIISMLVSFIFTNNYAESTITFFQFFTNFLSFFCISILIYQLHLKRKFYTTIYLVILTLVFIESSYVFYQILNEYVQKDLLGNFNRAFAIRGFTGNINVTAFSIVYKTPFLLFPPKYKSLKKVIYFITPIILFFTVFDLFHLSSRGALLALYVTILLFLIILFFKKDIFQKTNIFIILTLTFSILFSSYIVNKSKNINIIERTSSISINTVDGSVNQRIRFYKQIMNYVSNNFLPIGVGMYKIKSVDFDKENIRQYIVPYHAHNDFLEILIENGLLAFLSYALVFILGFYKTLTGVIKTNFFLFPPLLLFLINYFIDSSFNFPITRPVNFIFFNFIMSLIFILHFNLNEKDF